MLERMADEAGTGESGQGLAIGVRASTGRGPTSLAAFDAALRAAGVANFNLIRLSSVIPPGSHVQPVLASGRDVIDLAAIEQSNPTSSRSRDKWGDRLYAVWAFESAELLGQEAWAGVAWVQDPADGRGVFVEHEGGSEAQVRAELEASLASISRSRGLERFEPHHVVVGATCEEQPVAALVIAPYSTAGWS